MDTPRETAVLPATCCPPAGKRVEGEQTGEVTARILSSFLTEMDGLELAQGVLIMGATNRPQALDAALIRPGRFDVLLYVPPPDQAGRLQALQVSWRWEAGSAQQPCLALPCLAPLYGCAGKLPDWHTALTPSARIHLPPDCCHPAPLQIHSRSIPLAPDVDLAAIAAATGHYTGAELAAVCREAAMAALREDIQGGEFLVLCRGGGQMVCPTALPTLIGCQLSCLALIAAASAACCCYPHSLLQPQTCSSGTSRRRLQMCDHS